MFKHLLQTVNLLKLKDKIHNNIINNNKKEAFEKVLVIESSHL